MRFVGHGRVVGATDGILSVMAQAPPVRKLMKRREIPAGLRFITFSCKGGLALLGNPHIRDLFVRILYGARAKFGFELFAWVVMLEHAHLLVRPSDAAPLKLALGSLKQSVAERVLKRWKELDAPILRKVTLPDGRHRFWEKGGGFDRNVRDLAEFSREIRYIHRNPVEGGLVARPEDWKWSSVRWWMGLRDGERECDPPPGDPRAWQAWRGFV